MSFDGVTSASGLVNALFKGAFQQEPSSDRTSSGARNLDLYEVTSASRAVRTTSFLDARPPDGGVHTLLWRVGQRPSLRPPHVELGDTRAIKRPVTHARGTVSTGTRSADNPDGNVEVEIRPGGVGGDGGEV